MAILRIGTRKSRMARAQTRAAISHLAAHAGVQAEEVLIETSGDEDQQSRLSMLGGKGGAFVHAIRRMMLSGEIDLAMHSLKDMPGNDEFDAISETFAIGAHLPREDPRDCLVAKASAALDHSDGLIIGTSSLRRAAFARRLFPGIRIAHFRGAADSRIQKLDRGERQKLTYASLFPEAVAEPADAIVLAKSGLERIGLGNRISRVFSLEEMCPAIGQGVVVIECVRERSDLLRLLASCDHPATALSCRAERAMLRALNGHCNSPMAGICRVERGRLSLRGIVISADGVEFLEVALDTAMDPPERLGESVARRLLRNGAGRLIEEARFL